VCVDGISVGTVLLFGCGHVALAAASAAGRGPPDG
jgi:hypothetical protein